VFVNTINSNRTEPGPALILIIPDTRLAQEPALAASVNGCEAAYHAGVWYVTMPAEMWVKLPQEATLKSA
jgi:hypothetical protein